jgi:hypothetical protein
MWWILPVVLPKNNVLVWRCLQITFLPVISYCDYVSLVFAFISAPILSIFYCLSAIFLQIFQNNHVMWTVTDEKFFAYFIDNFNFVYKLTCQDNYLHFCINWWDVIQVFTPFIQLQLLYISSDHPAAQFVMSSHTVYSYTAQHNTAQYSMHICTQIYRRRIVQSV